jgi:hypothetical protein
MLKKAYYALGGAEAAVLATFVYDNFQASGIAMKDLAQGL